MRRARTVISSESSLWSCGVGSSSLLQRRRRRQNNADPYGAGIVQCLETSVSAGHLRTPHEVKVGVENDDEGRIAS